MINGAHIVLYSKDPEADRAFFRDVLQFPAVDAGHGWLIFALPPPKLPFTTQRTITNTNYSLCVTTSLPPCAISPRRMFRSRK